MPEAAVFLLVEVGAAEAIGAGIAGLLGAGTITPAVATAIGAGAISAGMALGRDENLSNVLKSAVVNGVSVYAGSAVAGSVASSVSSSLAREGVDSAVANAMGRVLGGAAGGAIRSGTSALLTNKDPIAALLKGGITGGLAAGVTASIDAALKDAPGFGEPANAVEAGLQRAVKTALANTALSGGDLSKVGPAVINSFISGAGKYSSQMKDDTTTVKTANNEYQAALLAYDNNIGEQNKLVSKYNAEIAPLNAQYSEIMGLKAQYDSAALGARDWAGWAAANGYRPQEDENGNWSGNYIREKPDAKWHWETNQIWVDDGQGGSNLETRTYKQYDESPYEFAPGPGQLAAEANRLAGIINPKVEEYTTAHRNLFGGTYTETETTYYKNPETGEDQWFLADDGSVYRMPAGEQEVERTVVGSLKPVTDRLDVLKGSIPGIETAITTKKTNLEEAVASFNQSELLNASLLQPTLNNLITAKQLYAQEFGLDPSQDTLQSYVDSGDILKAVTKDVTDHSNEALAKSKGFEDYADFKDAGNLSAADYYAKEEGWEDGAEKLEASVNGYTSPDEWDTFVTNQTTAKNAGFDNYADYQAAGDTTSADFYAQRSGWTNAAQKSEAAQAGFTMPSSWAAYVDNNTVDRQEVLDAFKTIPGSFIPSEADIEQLIGNKPDTNLGQQIQQYVKDKQDPIKEIFKSFEYEPSIEEINYFLNNPAETPEQTKQQIANLVDDKTVTKEEAKAAFEAAGYPVTEDLLNQFVGKTNEGTMLNTIIPEYISNHPVKTTPPVEQAAAPQPAAPTQPTTAAPVAQTGTEPVDWTAYNELLAPKAAPERTTPATIAQMRDPSFQATDAEKTAWDQFIQKKIADQKEAFEFQYGRTLTDAQAKTRVEAWLRQNEATPEWPNTLNRVTQELATAKQVETPEAPAAAVVPGAGQNLVVEPSGNVQVVDTVAGGNAVVEQPPVINKEVISPALDAGAVAAVAAEAGFTKEEVKDLVNTAPEIIREFYGQESEPVGPKPGQIGPSILEPIGPEEFIPLTGTPTEQTIGPFLPREPIASVDESPAIDRDVISPGLDLNSVASAAKEAGYSEPEMQDLLKELGETKSTTIPGETGELTVDQAGQVSVSEPVTQEVPPVPVEREVITPGLDLNSVADAAQKAGYTEAETQELLSGTEVKPVDNMGITDVNDTLQGAATNDTLTGVAEDTLTGANDTLTGGDNIERIDVAGGTAVDADQGEAEAGAGLGAGVGVSDYDTLAGATGNDTVETTPYTPGEDAKDFTPPYTPGEDAQDFTPPYTPGEDANEFPANQPDAAWPNWLKSLFTNLISSGTSPAAARNFASGFLGTGTSTQTPAGIQSLVGPTTQPWYSEMPEFDITKAFSPTLYALRKEEPDTQAEEE